MSAKKVQQPENQITEIVLPELLIERRDVRVYWLAGQIYANQISGLGRALETEELRVAADYALAAAKLFEFQATALFEEGAPPEATPPTDEELAAARAAGEGMPATGE